MRTGIKASTMVSESVDGAANASRFTVEERGVYHRGIYLARAQEFLDRADIEIAFVEPRHRLRWGQALGEDPYTGGA
jgi:hypothetical protein